MAGFGTELLLFCGLGYVVLGPRRMQQVLVQMARMKAQFEKTRQEVESQLADKLDAEPKDTKLDVP